MDAKKVLEDLKRRFPNEPEYHQAVEEVLGTIEVPHPAQQRYWPLQGWYPFPQLCEPWYPEVPRIRADFQELTHYTPNGWW